MEGKRLLHTLKLTNFLSYGPEGTEIELQPLNVLIGPNGSGKSNLIEAIGLLKAAPGDIAAPIRAGGGMTEWPWKGRAPGSVSGFRVETTVSWREGQLPLRYQFELTPVGHTLQFADETIEYQDSAKSSQSLYRFENGRQILSARETHFVGGQMTKARNEQFLGPGHIDLTKSILSQRKDPDRYPELTHLGNVFSDIQLFRVCSLGPGSRLRGPQRADQPASFLLEDGRNLGIVLNDLLNRAGTKKVLVSHLQRFYERVEDLTTKTVAGTVETFLHERDLSDSISSTRLSDGILRYLCLLSMLCHPEPPPLVCIEEPEIGLHPDAILLVATLLLEASERMQLVVTTHSDILVSALSEVPEAVVVCERDEEGSHLTRLEADQLKEWLKEYSLGEAWISGRIGGTT